MGPVSNWHGIVMVKAVLFETQGGVESIPSWATCTFKLVEECNKRIR